MSEQLSYSPTSPQNLGEFSETHPFRSKQNHDKLLKYLLERLTFGFKSRDQREPRMRDVDTKIAGWIALDEKDRERAIKEALTGDPMAKKQNLPLIFIHMDDLLTYLTQSFAPNRGMFASFGNATQEGPARGLMTLMNNQAVYAGYYREVALSCWNTLKYNLGGVQTGWDRDMTTSYQRRGGEMMATPALQWQGNRIRAFDMYNTCWDCAVEPSRVFERGEFVGTSFRESLFEIRRKTGSQFYFNVDGLGGTDLSLSKEGGFYVTPPRNTYPLRATSKNQTNWVSVFRGTVDEGFMENTYELNRIYIWINPLEFGLLPRNAGNRASRNRLEIWRFTLLGKQRVIEASHMTNVHNHLPAYFGTIHDDEGTNHLKSPAELLEPIQQVGSFAMNIHVDGMRKNVYGTTYYDPSGIDMSQLKDGEVSARVPVSKAGFGRDIRTMVLHDNNQVDTSQTLSMMQGAFDLANTVFPSMSAPNQIADMERAVASQVAAVQQGSSRRNHKMARILDETMFRPMRTGMFQNIVQYFDEDSTTGLDGNKVNIDISGLKTTDVEFVIGMGLKTLDRTAAANSFQSLIFAMIQNPQAAAQYDIAEMINDWANMIDLNLDMTKYRIQQAPATGAPQVGPDGNPLPFAPAVDPGAVTGPVKYKVQ